MDIVHVVLRLIHIIAAFIWFGAGAATLFYVVPAVSAAGDSGLRFMKTLLIRTPYARTFPAAAGVTMLAGILLYVVSDSASYFSTIGNAALGTGALAGILAGIHGGARTGRATRELGEALNQHVSDGVAAIPAGGVATLRERADRLAADARVSFILMVIALLGMSIARYL